MGGQLLPGGLLLDAADDGETTGRIPQATVPAMRVSAAAAASHMTIGKPAEPPTFRCFISVADSAAARVL